MPGYHPISDADLIPWQPVNFSQLSM